MWYNILMLSKRITSNYPCLNTFFSFEHIFLSILFEHQPFFSGSFSFLPLHLFLTSLFFSMLVIVAIRYLWLLFRQQGFFKEESSKVFRCYVRQQVGKARSLSTIESQSPVFLKSLVLLFFSSAYVDFTCYFSSSLRWKLRSSFLIYSSNAINFPLSTAFTESHRFWQVVFSFCSEYFLIHLKFLNWSMY